jgi:glycosyltransferase involved in cell wall biosynthesis
MQHDLRVGFVSIHDATDIHTWSGIPAQVLASLRKMDVQIELFSPLSQRSKYLLAPIKAIARMRKANISMDHYPLVMNSYARQIERAMRERPVDVIFSTSSIPIAMLKCPQPIIYWTDAVFHGMYDYYPGAFSGVTPGAIRRAKRQEEAALDNCSYAAYASEWAASTARKLTDPKKVCVLPFGASFDVEHNSSDIREWARSKRRERPRACKLLFIGVEWHRKGGAVAMETARILNERGIPTTLTIVGCDPPGAVPEYVRPMGFISKSTTEGREKMESLLRDSDLFILPTLAEAAGIVFCEASAFGLPSLSYATGGVPDYVRDGINGACLPVGTPAEGFANAAQELLQDAGRYEALCLRAFDEYANRLNWGTSVRGLVDLCRSALKSRP